MTLTVMEFERLREALYHSHYSNSCNALACHGIHWADCTQTHCVANKALLNKLETLVPDYERKAAGS